MKTGRLMIVSGPSGVGKDTLLDKWMEQEKGVRRVVACTTRAPRDGEVDGEEYIFLSHAEFERRVKAGKFLEHKNVHGQYYGTPKDQVDELLSEGFVAILKIDVQGALTVMDILPEVCTVFILPPSMEELERRLRSRATEPENKIQLRLQNARDEIAASARYQHRIVNDDLGKAIAELDAIKEALCTK